METILSRFLPVQPLTRQVLKFLFVTLALLGVVLALLPTSGEGIPHADKLMHATALFGFALLLDLATPRSFWRWKVPVLLFYGAFIELAQAFTPWRSVSVADFVADTSGILLYWWLWRSALQAYIPHDHG